MSIFSWKNRYTRNSGFKQLDSGDITMYVHLLEVIILDHQEITREIIQNLGTRHYILWLYLKQ